MRRMLTYAYDNGGKTFDRYTVFIPNGYAGWDCFTMSHNPLDVNGFNQFDGTYFAFNPSPRMGKRIYIKDLPKDLKTAIKERRNA